MKKRALSLLLTGCLVLGGLTACGSKETPTTPNTQPEESKQTTTEKAPEVEPENLTEVQKIIKEAEGMTMEELEELQKELMGEIGAGMSTEIKAEPEKQKGKKTEKVTA